MGGGGGSPEKGHFRAFFGASPGLSRTFFGAFPEKGLFGLFGVDAHAGARAGKAPRLAASLRRRDRFGPGRREAGKARCAAGRASASAYLLSHTGVLAFWGGQKRPYTARDGEREAGKARCRRVSEREGAARARADACDKG